MPPLPTACQCPVCKESFDRRGSLGIHLRANANNPHPCVIQPRHRPHMEAIKFHECPQCFDWFSRKPTEHLKTCTGTARGRRAFEAGGEDEAETDEESAPEDEVRARNLIIEVEDNEDDDDERVGDINGPLYQAMQRGMPFLDSLDWDQIHHCGSNTLEPPQGADTRELYNNCHSAVSRLFDQRKDEQAWKLHFFTIRVLFAKTSRDGKDGGLSVRKLFKHRCHSFMRGEWQSLWDDAKVAPQMGVRQPCSPTEEKAKQQQRADTRARYLANEGELSRALACFESAGVLNPHEDDIMQQLQALHQPDTVDEDLPDAPEDLDTNPAFEYKVSTIKVPGRGGTMMEVDTMKWILGKLKRGIAQGLTGARYDHYRLLKADVVKLMVTKLLNGDTSAQVRKVLTSCRGFALDKGDRKVRPVAIGEAIRRIAARVVCAQDGPEIAKTLEKVMQFGVGIKGGIEYAYHSVRLHMLERFDQYERDYGVQNGDDLGDEVPAGLKIDFKNGYNSTKRSKMLTQVQHRFPGMLRFVRYTYAQRASFVVMHKGRVVKEIDSIYGTQQGDPLGGHLFALSIYDFMLDLRDNFPQAAISWIVDDLTVSDTQAQLKLIAEKVDTDGPEYGLFKNHTKGEIYSHITDTRPNWKPLPVFDRLRYHHAVTGFAKPLLGGPFGTQEHVAAQALELAQDLTRPARHLHRLQHPHLEFQLLKHCICTTTMHLTRLVDPEALQPAIDEANKVSQRELSRIVADQGQPRTIQDYQMEWARQPINEGGLGLHNLALIALAAYMAALAGVARRASKIYEATQHQAARTIRAWFNSSTDFAHKLAHLAELVNDDSEERDTPNPICPSLQSIEKMPSQKALSEKLYRNNRTKLLDMDGMDQDERAWRLSSCQYGAGSWLHCIPAIRQFQCGHLVFKVMLQIRLGLTIAFAGEVLTCKCGHQPETARESRAFTHGWHWMSVCKKGHRITRHNKIRDVIASMYRSLSISVDVEVRGLYAQLTSYGEHKPADIMVPASAVGEGDTARALDIAITDPTCKTALDGSSHTDALKAAHIRHTAKMKSYRTALDMAGAAGLPFVKMPIVFETTGAMSKETRKWWKELVEWSQKRDDEREGTRSRREMGLEHTWSANDWSSYWLQRISLTHARHQAESIIQLIGASQPTRFDHS